MRTTDTVAISSLQQIANLKNLGYTKDVLLQAIAEVYGEFSVSEPTRSWREQDGVIYFSLMSDGTTGEEWIRRLEGNGFHVENYVKQILRSPDFQPTSGVMTEIAVLKSRLFTDNDRITKKIRAEADKRKFSKPNAEVACLIRAKFTDKEIKAMGLWWIVAMHEPIKDPDGFSYLLRADRFDIGCWFGTCDGNPDIRWNPGCGFAFVVSRK